MTGFEADIERCLQVLHEGGTILYPTDTVWGIGCDATNAAAVQKIIGLKDRPASKAFIVLVADERDIFKYVASPEPQIFDFLRKTTRPTTVIYQGPVGLADQLVHDDGTVAIRIVQETFCKHLLKRFRKPIVSTSANISGAPTPATYRQIPAAIREGVDYVVCYRQDDETPSQPSSIVKWNRGSLTYIRH